MHADAFFIPQPRAHLEFNPEGNGGKNVRSRCVSPCPEFRPSISALQLSVSLLGPQEQLAYILGPFVHPSFIYSFSTDHLLYTSLVQVLETTLPSP